MKSPSKDIVLVIDDDESYVALLEYHLRGEPYALMHAKDFDQAFHLIKHHRFAAMLLDYYIGEDNGLDQLIPLKRAAPLTPVLMVTGRQETSLVVRAMRNGAYDFFTKPIEPARVMSSIRRSIEHHHLICRVRQLEKTRQTQPDSSEMIGHSPQMATVNHVINNVAPTTASVMILGESGTGKELVARAIHQKSHRSNKPFVALNMAALPGELVESTLFGHERGAFTGADRRRIGACEEADGGTLFLDEICEMPIELQPKLLRFLQERVFRKVGAAQDEYSDVRIISATNRSPLAEVSARHMRGDLYYRLNVVPIALPPLRERTGDIDLLSMHAIHMYAQRHGKKFEFIEENAMEILNAYHWPGNVRQLLHLIERVVVLNQGRSLTADMLPEEILQPTATPYNDINAFDAYAQPAGFNNPDELNPRYVNPSFHSPPSNVASQNKQITSQVYPALNTPSVPQIHTPDIRTDQSNDAETEADEIIPMEELEKRAITKALNHFNGSPGKAAKALGMSEATIYRKIKAYKLK